MPERSEPEGLDAARLPHELRGTLLRGLGAFLQATPAPELPPSVRRFRGFRPAALSRHAQQILALLDDEGIRARVLEWLDEGRPSLPKDTSETLRAAAERSDRWQELVMSGAEGGGRRQAPQEDAERVADLERALEREKTKAKKARGDARAARSEAAQELKDARRELTEALERAETSERRRQDALRRAEAAEAAVRAERERAQREVRRSRRDHEKVKEERATLRAEVKDLRRRVKELEAAASAPSKKATRSRGGRRSAPPREPKGPRAPLAVPAGRLEDAPETLEGWLSVHGIHLVVDGYNVTMAKGGFPSLELEAQRDRLISEITKLVRRKRASATVVFDGRKVSPGTARLPRGPVKVEYSRPEETADDHIVALIRGLPPYPVVLATNDRELQSRARELGATIATSDQLLALIR